MPGLRIELQGTEDAAASLREVAERGEKLPTSLLERLGERWVELFRQNVVSNRLGSMAPISPVTRRLRRSGGGGPLQDTGSLLRELEVLDTGQNTASVGFRDATGRVGLLQRGGRTPAGSAIPGQRVPARPIVELTQEDADATVERIRDYVLRGRDV